MQFVPVKNEKQNNSHGDTKTQRKHISITHLSASVRKNKPFFEYYIIVSTLLLKGCHSFQYPLDLPATGRGE